MTNDLISRSKLLDALDLSECHNCRFGGEYCVDCKAIDAHKVLDEIINQPTAYDVDTVIKEIKETTFEQYYEDYYLVIDVAISTIDAIDIVKRGGVDDCLFRCG